ncbi:T9SS type A sorting domain-containing protein [Hymenobacter psychrotolerans]|uniref:Por secretion system C-terminal sorting domain-containing protein n=1 Tax=Hymenobacter psychrotolerans DSM 18569 TaxID=1121959 RepID=A0A1M6YRE8_9BACT|nr:right-handed parallel beta-helix repeat-containing protein [Hymenobacter psychrotolerans]SHL20838.1 Por secretion system C-terminal sorting domain-containing protein [Hymenobacter psychrotolerans DSM 18569]
MKKTLLALLLTWLATPALRSEAQYSTPGTGQRYTLTQLAAASGGYVTQMAGTWTITDTIRLAPTDTLSITTNETIRVADRALVSVDGVLRITPPDSVVFTAQNTAAPWMGMQLSATSNGSVLRRTVIERGGGVRVVDATVEFSDCTFRSNLSTVGGRLTNSAGLALSGNRALVQRCRFVRNARAGINSPSNRPTSPTIQDCIFWHNDTENGNYPQVNLGTGNPAQPILIERCLVVGNPATNMAGGIGVSNLLGGGGVTRVIIRRNTVRNNRYGIAVIGSSISSYVTGNIVENNNTNPNAATGGSGLNFQGNQTQTGVVSRNVVTGNLWGVTILRTGTVGSPAVSFGNPGGTDTTDVGRNRFVNNSNGGQIYDFYNNGPDAITAKNNDWGSASAAVIETHIFHQPDQSALGFVTFEPFLQPLATKAPALLGVQAYPNPAHAGVTFRVPGTGAVELQLLDALGRAVATRSAMPAGGQVALDVRAVAPGLYAYRLTQAGAVANGKLLVE